MSNIQLVGSDICANVAYRKPMIGALRVLKTALHRLWGANDPDSAVGAVSFRPVAGISVLGPGRGQV
jgi:hypothetical protein